MFTSFIFVKKSVLVTYPSISKNYLKESGSVSFASPSNIALVKYWGKREVQIPQNASLSFTLTNCRSETTIHFEKKSVVDDAFSIEFLFEGLPKPSFEPKILTFFKRIEKYCPFLKDFHFKIESINTFPHSSGIASSASSMSAIAVALVAIEEELGNVLTDKQSLEKASLLARLGSGSACRSIEGPIMVWGGHPNIKGSNDEFAVTLEDQIHPIFDSYQDTILLIDKGEKQVSSTVGHNLMYGHPFAEKRFEQANENIELLKQALINGDINKFIEIVESEALTLHAMMMTSSPYFILMKPKTLEAIEAIWAFRKETSIPLCFTLDAGANVHLLYPEKWKNEVFEFIESELSQKCQNNQYICDSVGNGAFKL